MPSHSTFGGRHLVPDLGWLAAARWRRTALAAAALLALALVPGLLRLETDNSPEVFFVRDAQGIDAHRAFRQTFGSDQVVRLLLRGEALWSAEGLVFLALLEQEAAAVPGIAAVSGLYGYGRRSGDPQWPPRDPEALRHSALASELARDLGWIGRDGSATSVLLVLEAGTPEEDRRRFADLRRLLGEAPPGISARLVGLPVLNQALNDSSREIEQRFFPLLVLFAALILLASVRDVAGLIKPLAFVGLCELLVVGPMGYAGVELNMVLAILPPLVFVIALATALHLQLRFRDRMVAQRARGIAGAVAACRETYREKGWSVFWTGLTTLIGFTSLGLSPVGPVRSLGLWAGWGLGMMTIVAFTFYPALLVVPLGRRARRRPLELRARKLGRRWGEWSHRRRRLVLTVTLLVTAGALAGLPRIRLESNALRYLAPEHPVRAGIEALEREGIGAAVVEAVVAPADGSAEAPFASAPSLVRLAELGRRLKAEERVLGVVSAGSFVDDALGRLGRMPFFDETLREALVLRRFEAEPEGRQILASFLSDDRRRARVSVFVATGGVEELELLLERLRQTALELFPGAEIQITGEYPMLLEAQRHLISTLTLSFGLTLLAVALIFRTLLPGTRLTALALLPNLWPVLGALGAMGWLGLPLDIATVMVASVVLGLAVDDTLHTLGHFRHLAPRHGARGAVARTLEITAPAYLLTGLILAAGFGICALSEFAPIARFGALSAFAILLAVLGDLFLLPAILSLTPSSTIERWRRKSESVDEKR